MRRTKSATKCTVIVCCPYCRSRNISPRTGASLLGVDCAQCGHVLEFHTTAECPHCAVVFALDDVSARKRASPEFECPRCRGELADGIPAAPLRPPTGTLILRLFLRHIRALLAHSLGWSAGHQYDLLACQRVYCDLHHSWKEESLAREAEAQTDIREQENVRGPDRFEGECESMSESRHAVWNRHRALLEKYRTYVDVMLRSANAKVFVDEYGDETWKGADRDIDAVVEKIIDKEESAEIGEYSIEFLTRCGSAFQSAYAESWLWDELFDQLLRYHQDHKTSPCGFDQMSGVQFEEWVIGEIKRAGITSVLPTKRTGDQGADIIAGYGGITVVIQAKCYQRSVGNDAVQEVHAAKAHYRADQAWAVTNARFTPSARRLANSTGVRLVDGSGIHAIGQLVAQALLPPKGRESGTPS